MPRPTPTQEATKTQLTTDIKAQKQAQHQNKHRGFSAPSHLHDGVLVAVQGAQTVPCPRVPELDEVILAAGHYQRLVRVPLYRLHIPPVPR